jgi:phosphate-selective porin OprO/OprP
LGSVTSSPRRKKGWLARALSIALIAVAGFPAAALSQTAPSASPGASSTPSPSPLQSEEPPPDTGVLDRKVHLSGAVLTDYTMFSQDPTNVRQVGVQPSQPELRAARIVVQGNLTPGMFYYFAPNFNGLQVTPPKNQFQIYDLYLGFRTPVGLLSVGQQKETFVYEMVGLSMNLPQQERVLNPFFQSRALGVKLASPLLHNKRATYSLGWFPLNYDGNQFTGRTTYLPYISDDDARYVHVGVDYRYLGSANHTLQFSGKPESNVADSYVNTGKFPANYANELDYEFVATVKSVSLYGEYARAWVNAPASLNPEFFGYYILGSWVITGETRPYDRATGYGKRILPTKPSGAWEFVAQFSRDDLNSGLVQGGSMGLGYVGVNWWRNNYWKFGLGYGITGLTADNAYGIMKRLQFRVQWSH